MPEQTYDEVAKTQAVNGGDIPLGKIPGGDLHDVVSPEARDTLKTAQEPVSSETPVGKEEAGRPNGLIPDDDASESAEAASFTLLREQIQRNLSSLTPFEEKVLRLRFGLDDGKPRTLEEVGQEFDVTHERIRQIEAKALRHIHPASRARKLRDWLN